MGIRVVVFDRVDSRSDRYSLSVVMRRRSNELTQMVTAVYGPSCSENRQDFSKELRAIRNWWDFSWVKWGDLTIVKFPDKCRGGDNNDRDRHEFNNLISKLRMIKVPFKDQ